MRSEYSDRIRGITAATLLLGALLAGCATTDETPKEQPTAQPKTRKETTTTVIQQDPVVGTDQEMRK